jgi:hypothetical protein
MVGFDPTSIGLPADFVMLDYSKMKGWACKVPQEELLRILDKAGLLVPVSPLPQLHTWRVAV